MLEGFFRFFMDVVVDLIPWPARHDDESRRMGESKLDRDARRYWLFICVGLATLAIAGHVVFALFLK